MTQIVKRRSRSYVEAERHGRWAEELCALMLRLKGYRVLARHWKSGAGELDIVARRRRTVAVIEVKARASHGSAAESVSARQRKRIGRATEWFLAGRPDLADCQVRFDVMLVVPWRPPLHVQNAWHQER